MYYAPEIFKETGAGTNASLIQTILVGLINFLFTILALWLIDKVGRKALITRRIRFNDTMLSCYWCCLSNGTYIRTFSTNLYFAICSVLCCIAWASCMGDYVRNFPESYSRKSDGDCFYGAMDSGLYRISDLSSDA